MEAGMQIVSDRGADLSPEQMEGLKIHYAPLRIALDGKSYTSGVDLQPAEFYQLLDQTDSFPTTSQPSAGDFVTLYRDLAKSDPDILSIHISSGLSGTVNSARTAAAMVPEANVTIVDTLTLSVPEGWVVQAAGLALKAGWSMDRIQDLMAKINAQANGFFTLSTLKYLVHGGRISHIKGLIASMLNIKPIIGVEKIKGTYVTHGQEITLKRAISKMVDVVAGTYAQGTLLRVQPIHGMNLESVEYMVRLLKERLSVYMEPVTYVAPVLGAHTGAGLVGLSVAPKDLFKELID
jgi:DegV family protein with EDD domain